MCPNPTTQSYGGAHTGPCWHAWVYSQRTCSWPCGPHRYRHGKSAGIVYWGQHLPQASLPSPRASPPPPACPSSEYSGRRRGICVPSPHLRDNVHVTSQHGTGKEVYWTSQQHTTLQASSIWMQLQATKFHFSKTTFIVKRSDIHVSTHNVHSMDLASSPSTYTEMVRMVAFSHPILRVLAASPPWQVPPGRTTEDPQIYASSAQPWDQSVEKNLFLWTYNIVWLPSG